MARKTNRALVTTQEEIDKINPDNKELMEDFYNYLETTDHSPKSIIVYKSNLNIFFVYLMKYAKNKDFVDIKKRDVMNFQNYCIKNGLSPSRIRVLKSSISSLSNFIESVLDEEEKWEDFRNIINKIPAPTLNPVREKTVLSDEQLDFLLEKLIENGKIQIACFVAMSAFSGSRKSETIQYKREFFTDETCKNGLYVTPKIRTKGRGVMGKMLNKYCIKSKVDKYLELWDKERLEKGIESEWLFVLKKNNQWVQAKESVVGSWMKTCTEILGEDCYSHSYRHFFVSWLVRCNIPIEVIKDIVGHSDVSTSQRYDDNPKEDGFMKYFSDDGIVNIERKSLNEL